MKILANRLISYGGFLDSGWVSLGSGINLIVGENNAGKSQFLRSLGQSFAAERHRNAAKYRDEHLSPSIQQVDISFSGLEFSDAWLRLNSPLYWPVKKESGDLSSQAKRSAEEYIAEVDHSMKLVRGEDSAFQSRVSPAHGLDTGPNFRSWQIMNTALGVVAQASTGEDNVVQVA